MAKAAAKNIYNFFPLVEKGSATRCMELSLWMFFMNEFFRYTVARNVEVS